MFTPKVPQKKWSLNGLPILLSPYLSMVRAATGTPSEEARERRRAREKERVEEQEGVFAIEL